MSADYINKFPGYEYKMMEDGKYHNMYRGVDLGKGGWVYSEPGIYTNVVLLDIQSLHPHSIVALNKLGEYTQNYADLLRARVCIKEKNFEEARKLYDGRLAKYLENKDEAKALSKVLKLPLNAFFGVSFATFQNPARDSRDVNNIIALRGALFMKTLFDEVEAKGYKIRHVKTDSVKVSNGNFEIIKFIQDFAKKYGYVMEHEATYDRMCLIDDAQYIAAYMKPEECMKQYGYVPGDNEDHFREFNHPWTATGKAFQRPCVFKSLFSGEPIEFEDRCETKSVKDAAIYLDMDEKLPDVKQYEKELERRIFNSTNKKKMKLNPNLSEMSDEDLKNKISTGHKYDFVGRVGSFCPIKPGLGGGLLVVKRNEKFDSVTGSKGYRWLESEKVKGAGREDDVDVTYHQKQINESIEAIEEFGSFERFIDTSRPYEDDRPKPKAVDISYEAEAEPATDDDPPWSDLPPVVPCGDGKYNSCLECPNCSGDECKAGYSIAVNGGGVA